RRSWPRLTGWWTTGRPTASSRGGPPATASSWPTPSPSRRRCCRPTSSTPTSPFRPAAQHLRLPQGAPGPLGVRQFAHACFLRGQTHLLPRIVRRHSGGGSRRAKEDGDEDEGISSTALAMEVVRLRNEQRATEERVAAMWRRVQETERRPKQMLAFLLKVVGDPDVLRRLAGSGQDQGARVNRPRLLLDGREEQRMPVDGLSYHNHSNLNMEEAFVLEPSVDLYYAGGDGQADGGGGGHPPYAEFHVDSGY
ncbi:hypothetical protein CFC21_059822, partial [Triticum aestivum]